MQRKLGTIIKKALQIEVRSSAHAYFKAFYADDHLEYFIYVFTNIFCA